jgi:hypothetical protein
MGNITAEMHAHENYCMEMFLQWLQVRRQQSLNMKFAVPSLFNDGELAAYNTTIRQLENALQKRNEYWKICQNSPHEFHQAN